MVLKSKTAHAEEMRAQRAQRRSSRSTLVSYPCSFRPIREIRVEVEYTWLGKLENELRGREVRMGETSFTDKVTLLCLPLAAETEAFSAWMTDLTQGQAVISAGEEKYYPNFEFFSK